MPILLDDNALKVLKSEQKSWSFETDGTAMNIELKFDGFSSAIGFVVQVAIIAEKMNHHPDFVNNYKNVTVCWTSHSVGGVTNMDFRLAKRTDECACGKVA